VRVFIISCEIWAPHLILPCTNHLAMPSCIILRIAFTCIDLCYYFLVCAIWFFSSRRRRRAVRPGVRVPSGGSCRCFYLWSDRRAHPFTYFTFTCSFDLLLSLCCDSVVSRVLSTCYLYVRDTPPRPTFCLLFSSFASRRRV
jgi:hypothetical protein